MPVVSVRFSDGDLAAVKRAAGETPISTWLKKLAGDAVAAKDALEGAGRVVEVPAAGAQVVRQPEPIKGYSRIESPAQVPEALQRAKPRPMVSQPRPIIQKRPDPPVKRSR